MGRKWDDHRTLHSMSFNTPIRSSIVILLSLMACPINEYKSVSPSFRQQQSITQTTAITERGGNGGNLKQQSAVTAWGFQ
jgi:hypothetical protein